MHAIIPLLYIFLFFNKDQLRNDSPYRVCVFSLIGLSYFVFIQYIMYYYWVFPSDSLLQYLPGVVVVGGILGLCLSPWVKRATPIKAVICGTVFLAGALSSLIFDVEIKEQIAVAGGFYRVEPQQHHFAPPAELNSENIEFNRVGYSLEQLRQWSHKTASSGYDFLTAVEESKTLAEIRPNCFNDLGVDTPKYIENSLFAMAAEGQEHMVECIKNEGNRECLIKVKYNENHDTIERWRWFRYSAKNKVNPELDILFYNNQSKLRAEAAFMLKSLQLLPPVSDVYCLTPAEWL